VRVRMPHGSEDKRLRFHGLWAQVSYVVSIDGRRVKWGTDELSPDGKTLTATSWKDGAESEKMVEIFVRQ
jgi:hypothetical protein